MDVDAVQGISDEIKERMQKRSQELSKERKKRQASPALANSDSVAQFKPLSSNPVHKASSPGILCLDIHPDRPELIVTGGVDSSLVLFNKDTSKIVGTLNGHAKRVNSVQFYPGTEDMIVLSASQDRTARVWRGATSGDTYSLVAAHVVKVHEDDVVGVSLHATGDYFATASLDRTWAFHDIHTGRCLAQVRDSQVQSGFECVQFHPDGLILGTGTSDSLVRVWDIKSQTNVATFEGHTGRVVDIAFSENGFYLATAGSDGVKLWDLRKLKNFHSIPSEGQGISAVAWDYTGNYLAMAGQDIRILHGKSLSHLKTYGDHSASVTDVKFGRDAEYFASTSMDRTLKIWGEAK